MKTNSLALKVATGLMVCYLIWGMLVITGSDSREDFEEARTYMELGGWVYAPGLLWAAAWISGAWVSDKATNQCVRYTPFALSVAAIGTALTFVFLVSSSA